MILSRQARDKHPKESRCRKEKKKSENTFFGSVPGGVGIWSADRPEGPFSWVGFGPEPGLSCSNERTKNAHFSGVSSSRLFLRWHWLMMMMMMMMMKMMMITAVDLPRQARDKQEQNLFVC
jgi:hypothetical protein